MSRNYSNVNFFLAEKTRKKKFLLILKNLMTQGRNYFPSQSVDIECVSDNEHFIKDFEFFKISEANKSIIQNIQCLRIMKNCFDSNLIGSLLSKFKFLFSTEDHLLPIFLIYIDKFFEGAQIDLAQDLILNIMVVAAITTFKFHMDDSPPLIFFSRIFKLDLAKLNEMEIYFHSVLKFDLICTEREIHLYENELDSEI